MTIGLEDLKKVVEELANEIKIEFPNLLFDYAGMIPVGDESYIYDCTPINTKVFATTGGDGVHYSILEISEEIQPIIMTVPMNFSDSINHYNKIIGENLNEFLSLGYYNGWFPLEELCYKKGRAIEIYSKENLGFLSDGDVHFVKKLRNMMGINHVPLDLSRLEKLESMYFDQLKFKSDFIEQLNKK